MIQWKFSKKVDQSRELADSITDSKFNINPFGSFTREIIQNSLDVLDKDNCSNVIVKFEIKQMKLSEIPGGYDLLNTIKRCKESTNHLETVNKYKRAIDILNSDSITCLKVSDYNTIGLDENGWDTLVNKIGATYKPNDTSAGRHGIGKKAAFLMSLCNTVFYASKNTNGEIRFGGKSILTDWKNDNDEWFSMRGWYGDLKNIGEKSEVYPIMNDNSNINSFFKRIDQNGTDVIIIALDESNDMVKTIINSLLENFYIGIKEGKLQVKIGNINIDKDSLDSVINAYYTNTFSRVGMGSDNIVIGLLKDYDKAYKEGIKKTIKIEDPKGSVDLYLTTENTEKRKYYAFYRDHGMKIRDYYLQTDKSFSAIVIARGKELNDFLLSLENAAHDDFIVDKNNPSYNEISRKLRNITGSIEDYFRSLTKLETSDSFLLDELNDMITYYGDISKKKKVKNQKKTKSNEINALIQHKSDKKTEDEWSKDYDPFDVPNPDPEPKPTPPEPNPRPLPIVKDTDENGEKSKNAVKEVSFERVLIYSDGKYNIRLRFANNLTKVRVKLFAKNVDGSFNDITSLIEDFSSNGQKFKVNDEVIIFKDIIANEDIIMQLKLKNERRYKVFVKIQGVEDESKL